MVIVFIIIAVVIVVIIAAYAEHAKKNKCSVCNEWNCIEILSRDLVSKTQTTMTVTDKERVRSDYGQWRTIERQRQVPAIKEVYHITAVCKKCGAPKEYDECKTYRI